MNRQWLWSILLVCLMFNIVDISQTQVNDISFTGNIIYSKYSADQSLEFIQLSEDGSFHFPVPTTYSDCASVSPMGSFVAIGDATQQVFRVYRFIDASLITQHPLPNGWRKCNLGWKTNHQLTLYAENEGKREFITFNVQDDSTTTQTISIMDVVTDYEQRTPNKMPNQDSLLLGNNLIIYPRCQNDSLSTDQRSCSTFPQVVIYDYLQQKDIAILADASPYDFDPTMVQMPLISHTIFPSPSGRYVLYLSIGIRSDRLRIFDTQTVQYVNADSFNTIESEAGLINPLRGFTWNPNESLVGFWSTIQLPSEPNNPSVVSFRIFDIVTNTIKVFDSVHQLFGGFFWSPDSQAIALVNTSQELILMDTQSGAVSVLDTEVYAIRSWAAQ